MELYEEIEEKIAALLILYRYSQVSAGSLWVVRWNLWNVRLASPIEVNECYRQSDQKESNHIVVDENAKQFQLIAWKLAQFFSTNDGLVACYRPIIQSPYSEWT
jgi:hypothetical protein